MESGDQAHLTIRVTRQEKDGSAVVEEREAVCRAEDLARHLGEPWEVARSAEPPERALEAIERHVLQSLQVLQCVVTEGRDEQDRRTWAISWRRADDPGPEAGDEPADRHDAPPVATPRGEEPVIAATRGSHVHLRADNGERAVRMHDGRNQLYVLNNSYAGVTWGCAYSICDLHMEVHIHPPA